MTRLEKELDTELIEKELDTELRSLYYKWRTIGYPAGYFWRMLTSKDPGYGKGPLGTVRHLLGGEPSMGSGFMRLLRANKLEWTVEALLLDPKWKPLFTDLELQKAKSRLDRYRRK